MQKTHQIDRSKVNESTVRAQDFPKSGFNLSYRNFNDYILGRLHVSGFHHIMAGDKFSGSNNGSFTFNRLVTPNVSTIECCQHNFYIPYRALDTTLEEDGVPTALNNMSSSWHTPSFTLQAAIKALLDLVLHYTNTGTTQTWESEFLSAWHTAPTTTISTADLANVATLKKVFTVLAVPATDVFDKFYMHDYLKDLNENLVNHLNMITATSTYYDFRMALLHGIIAPFFGPMSLLDFFQYNYVRESDFDVVASRTSVADMAAFYSLFDDVPQCEYALRAYYAIWYEYYRDVNLEPKSSNLPNWRKFGSSSVITAYPLLLLTRIRSWQKDLFTSALPDDMMRHVFAPVINYEEDDSLCFSVNDEDYLTAENNDKSFERGIIGYHLSWRDSLTGNTNTLVCPLPSSVNDSLTALYTNPSSGSYNLPSARLDLLTLRRAQMLEQYLKRNFYFGDEYKDRMLAHYGVRVSDMRINRPELLSSSISTINTSQEVANVGTSEVAMGDRLVTATAGTGNDGYAFFAEEFGIVVNLLSFMPVPQYAGICPQNLLSKVTDFPLPEFSNQQEEFSRVMEVATNGLKKSGVDTLGCFGHHPYAHAWRSRVDVVGGKYLSDRQNYTFRRFFGLDSAANSPKLNYTFIHCHPNLGMFANTNLLDGQLYGTLMHEFYVERVLPTPVESI